MIDNPDMIHAVEVTPIIQPPAPPSGLGSVALIADASC